MSNFTLRILGFLLIPLSVSGQVEIPQYSLTADGFPDVNEWNAIPVQAIIPRGVVENSSVQLAWDTQYLYARIDGNLESIPLFPELLIDVNNDKSANWDNNDHWFHISATDCHSDSAYGDYSQCEPQATGWIGGPNMAGGAVVDIVEFAIPWSFLNYTPSIGDTIGFSMVVTNTSNEWHLWPAGADRFQPSSWGYIYLGASISLEEQQLQEPTSQRINSETIRIINVPQNANWKVIDMTGRVLKKGNSQSQESIELAFKNDQLRIMQIESEGRVHTLRLM